MTATEFREAFHSHKDVLYRFALRMTGSRPTAEDVVQDCFLALWRSPSAYDSGRGGLRPYLLGMARNLVLRLWRDERTADALEEDSAVSAPPDIAGRERAEIVARAVGALPPLQREVLILAEYEDLSLEEIARATEAEIAAVKSRLHRARENLRRMLAPLLERKGSIHGPR